MKKNIVIGKVWKYGDNINTDVIFPGRYTYRKMDEKEMASHSLEDLDRDFAKNVQKNDFIVAGKNFGCGSSREQSVFCLKYASIGGVIAKSFSRLYFRNSINAGLPVLVVEDIYDYVSKGDEIEVNFTDGIIKAKDKIFNFPPLPDEIMEIMSAGGLVPYLKKKISY